MCTVECVVYPPLPPPELTIRPSLTPVLLPPHCQKLASSSSSSQPAPTAADGVAMSPATHNDTAAGPTGQ